MLPCICDPSLISGTTYDLLSAEPGISSEHSQVWVKLKYNSNTNPSEAWVWSQNCHRFLDNNMLSESLDLQDTLHNPNLILSQN